MSRRRDSGARLWCLTSDEYRGPLLNDILADPDAVMAGGRVLKHDGTTTVAVVSDARRRWVVKRYNTKNRWHAVRRALRTSRAVNCWRAAAWLTEAGVETPRPVAVLEERRLGTLKGRSYFLCEHVDGDTLLEALARPGVDRPTLIERAAGVVRRLARHGIAHGDLKATNFIVSGERLFLVDLDAARRASGRRLEHAVQRDRRRFMKNWAHDPRLSEEFEVRLSAP